MKYEARLISMQVLPSNINHYHFFAIVYIRLFTFVYVDDVIFNKLDRSVWYFGVRVSTWTNEFVRPIERSVQVVCSFVRFVRDQSNAPYGQNTSVAFVVSLISRL